MLDGLPPSLLVWVLEFLGAASDLDPLQMALAQAPHVRGSLAFAWLRREAWEPRVLVLPLAQRRAVRAVRCGSRYAVLDAGGRVALGAWPGHLRMRRLGLLRAEHLRCCVGGVRQLETLWRQPLMLRRDRALLLGDQTLQQAVVAVAASAEAMLTISADGACHLWPSPEASFLVCRGACAAVCFRKRELDGGNFVVAAASELLELTAPAPPQQPCLRGQRWPVPLNLSGLQPRPSVGGFAVSARACSARSLSDLGHGYAASGKGCGVLLYAPTLVRASSVQVESALHNAEDVRLAFEDNEGGWSVLLAMRRASGIEVWRLERRHGWELIWRGDAAWQLQLNRRCLVMRVGTSWRVAWPRLAAVLSIEADELCVLDDATLATPLIVGGVGGAILTMPLPRAPWPEETPWTLQPMSPRRGGVRLLRGVDDASFSALSSSGHLLLCTPGFTELVPYSYAALRVHDPATEGRCYLTLPSWLT